MTSSVAQLFTINRTSHLKFFKNSSQLNESKIDIPIGRGSTSNLNNPLNESQIVANAVDWVNSQGKKFLDEAKERLQIDTKNYLFKDQPLQQLSIEELNKVKKNVKNELKKYDQTFIHLFFRQPAKTDKEPLRPLYMYYKKLKTLIANFQKNPNKQPENRQGTGPQQTQGRSISQSSAQSNTSKMTFTTNGSSNYGSSRENSLTNQSPFGSQTNSSLTIQDLNSNGGINVKKSNDMMQQKQQQFQMKQQQPQQQNQQQNFAQQNSKNQQPQDTKFQERKNSATMNQQAQNILTQIEKDPQGRLMGVRGSVELKSINSMTMGNGVLGNGQQTTNSNGGQIGSGFAWTQSSKNQPQSSKAQSSKQQQPSDTSVQLSGQFGQFSKNDMMNVRKSAQAVTMASLLDNNNNTNGYGNQMIYQQQNKQSYNKNGGQQQQLQDVGNTHGRHHHQSSSSQQINFYPMYQPQQQQNLGNERKENTNPFNFEEPKNSHTNGGLITQQMQQKKDKRPQSANQVQQTTTQNMGQAMQKQLKEQKDLLQKIDDYKKERAGLRNKLDSFRKQFEQTYNRKIRFKRDIKEVESEFKRYKDLKEDIQKMEKQLQRLQQ